MLAAALAFALLMPGGASTVDKPAKASSAPQKSQVTAPATANKKAPARKATAPKSRSRRASWRTGQQTPTRERYAEIQRALIERGYSQAPATGVWGPEWVSALKRFQSEHKLEPSGRLNSLTLIALGLGPNRASPGDAVISRPDSHSSQAEPQ